MSGGIPSIEGWSVEVFGMTTVADRWLAKRADASQGRLEKSVKSLILRDFKRVGLDGNGSFKEVGDGIRAAFDILQDREIDPGDILNAHLFRGDQGRRSIGLVFQNPGDAFSPIVIQNSELVFSWYRRESGNFEILAYLS